MKTIKEAAESAAKELIEDGIGYSFIGFDGLSFHGASPERLTNVIALHFSDYAALRDAADRAEKHLETLYDHYGSMAREDKYDGFTECAQENFQKQDEVKSALTALRGLLNTQPTKET